MKHPIRRLYALSAYAVFVATFVYLIGFVAGWGVPKGIDDGPSTQPVLAVAIDVGLALFFGLVHSVMARASFKRVWTKFVPPAAERSTYVLVASAQLGLLCWQWRPIGSLPLWAATGALAWAVSALQAAGWGTALLSTYLIDHFELFGLRQGLGGSPVTPVLRTPGLYRWVRHPLYFGQLLALWSAPTMSVGHLLFSTLLTVYIVIGVRHEERDLVRVFGDEYRRYQAAVPMLIPFARRAGASRLAGVSISQ
jgi:protein-S-isoprenylcysteine O-methyltransferase Ste14